MKYSKKIKKIARSYFDELDKGDFSHGFTHVQRVVRLALNIGKKEGADLEILKAASLLHDLARGKEDKGEVPDHAQESARLAKRILEQIGFPSEKTASVCHCIEVHRSKPEDKPKTLEAKILQDADRLDALGAVDIARVIGSKIQSEKYGGPIYIDESYRGEKDSNKSAIHYLIYKSKHPKRRPESFNTPTAKKMAENRFKFMEDYIRRFIAEWKGKA